MLEKVISGGQIGIDRMGLDIALELGIPVGGWCPAGRRAEGGPIPEKYPLKETTSWAYQPRTKLNIQEADATLLIYYSLPLKTGTALTARLARELGKPLIELYLPSRNGPVEPRIAVGAAGERLVTSKPWVLNIAGPRAIPEDRLDFTIETVEGLLRKWRDG